MILLICDIDGTIASYPDKLFPIKVKDVSTCRGCNHLQDKGCFRPTFCEKSDGKDIPKLYSSESITEFEPIVKVRDFLLEKIKKYPSSINIVYISGRGVNLLHPTKVWLEKHGFPLGEVYCVGDGQQFLKNKINKAREVIIRTKPRKVYILEDDLITANEYYKEFAARNLLRLIV